MQRAGEGHNRGGGGGLPAGRRGAERAPCVVSGFTARRLWGTSVGQGGRANRGAAEMTDRARRATDDLNADTQQVPSYDQMRPSSARLPTLTILYHPRLDRIGERVQLPDLRPGTRVAVSRLEPEFAPPFQASAALPLATSFLSRRPTWLTAEYSGSFTIDAQESGATVLVDGFPVAGTFTIPAASVAKGAVIELGGQVILLLHLAMDRAEPGERYGLVGESDGIQDVRAAIGRIARSAGSALVRGATGTGKELVAAAIHAASDRAHKPYLTVNMAAIPASLAASELFGYVKGAFSGATRASIGFFGRADHGTLFMDEVGDTPPEVQAALLRVLETGEVQQIGAEHPRKVDVRLIAATDAELEKEVSAGRFRAPLFYRLANQEVRLPLLSERRDDIGRLLVHFLHAEFVARGIEAAFLDQGPDGASWLPVPVVARLARYPWPGNVRQLRNVARYLASLEHSEGGVRVDDPQLDQLLPLSRSDHPTIEDADLGLRAQLLALAAAVVPAGPRGAPVSSGAEDKRPSELTPEEVERALSDNDYKLGPAAVALGISRPALNELVDAHPSLVRANNLLESEIKAALDAAGGDLDQAWRALKVSKRGLKLRMSALGIGGDGD